MRMEWLVWLSLAVAPLAEAAFAAGVADAATGPSARVEAFVASLEGGWVGEENATPFGPMAMAMLFEWIDDGVLRAHSALDRETYIDVRFARDGSGRWMLIEEAAMEGLGVQRYRLAPVTDGREDRMHRWIWEEDPEFLSIDLAVRDETLHFDVTLRGEPHVAFRLQQRPEDELESLREQLAAQAERAPDAGRLMRRGVVGAPEVKVAGDADDPVRIARASVAAEPHSAAHQLALAKALGGAMRSDPATGPRYAGEMLGALETAIALDPALVEAYHWLVGFYLEAPPIAGGSIEAARATAERLVAIAPNDADGLLRRVEARAAELGTAP